MALGVQSTPPLARQDRRFQNTYEDRPAELQQLFQPTEEPSKMRPSPSDDRLRQDQLYAQNLANRYTTLAPPPCQLPPPFSEMQNIATAAPASATSADPDPAPCRFRIPAQAARSRPDLASCQSRISQRTTSQRQDSAFRQSGIPPQAVPPRPDMAPCLSRTLEPAAPLRPAPAPCRTRTSDACCQTAPALHLQHADLQHHLQPIRASAAGGRGSSSAPPVGPDDQAVDNGNEADSAFYRNATFTRDTDSASSPLILTELPLDPFDGDIRQYPAFRNRFLDIVESHPDLPPRHKLMYLLQYLRGEPYRFASGLQLTDANYFVVVNQLEERYANEDMLRNLLIGEFVNLRPPSDEVTDLYRFYDSAFRVSNELKQLGDDVDASRVYEQILMGRLSEKLRLKLIQIYGYGREKSVGAILDGLRR